VEERRQTAGVSREKEEKKGDKMTRRKEETKKEIKKSKRKSTDRNKKQARNVKQGNRPAHFELHSSGITSTGTECPSFWMTTVRKSHKPCGPPASVT